MTTSDLNQIRGVVKEEIDKALDEKLVASEKRLRKEISLSGEQLKKEIAAVEERLKQEMATSDSRVMTDIGSFMETNLFPMIEEKADKSDIDRLENKLEKVISSNSGYEARLKDIEAIPTIAHQLRTKKSN